METRIRAGAVREPPRDPWSVVRGPWLARRSLGGGGAGVRRQLAAAALTMLAALWWSATAFAQLDPLLFVKRVPPTIILVVDTSLRMLEDGAGRFYDPNTYSATADPAVTTAFGLGPTVMTYRRVYHSLAYENVQDSSSKFFATDITAVPSTSPGFSTFWNDTRLEIARLGIQTAVQENRGPTLRWGLITLRQQSPQWRVSPACDKPVRVTVNAVLMAASDSSPCNAGPSGRYGIYTPTVASANYTIETPYGGGGALRVVPNNGTSAAVLASVNGSVGSGSLVPAGAGASGHDDRPLSHALDDARAAAVAAMANDTAACRSCRNTVVVLITGGADSGDSTYDATHDPLAIASTFLSVSGGGVTKRVPIHVIGVRAAAGDKAELQGIASNSAGRFVDAVTANDVTAAINYAVQTGFSRSTNFETGEASEYQPVSPIVGTVNLKDARDANGAALPNTDIASVPGNQPLSQRSNVMITAGFTLPGYEGRMRAFRVYRPEADLTKPSGWEFVADGSRLWPDLDGRPDLAGVARAPADPSSRNIYTYVPGTGVVAFDAGNAALLAPHMGPGVDVATLIGYVRSQPIGAIIGSTPALMDAPSLDPPPDDDYGRPDAAGSFAARFKDRRSLIFFGANDGMIHAVDARTGYEIWAFVPYNLLPKLRTLLDGQPVEQFDYFVDSSPKVAEVKVACTAGDPGYGSAGCRAWRSLLIIGQGPGGTFYQAFDVTEAGMGVDPGQGDLSSVTSLLGQYDTVSEANDAFTFKWSFPDYANFDPAFTGTFSVADGTPGGRIRIYGDLRSSASDAEKAVGFTWSDPAVGPLNVDRSVSAVIAGSGYFPPIEDGLPGRGSTSPRAGAALYLLDPDTGRPIGNASGSCPDSGSATGCISVGDVSSNGRKNALQADPTAAGESGSHVVTKAYLGDIDGRYWRFNLAADGSIARIPIYDAGAPIYASSALLFIGTVDVYTFFSTGSDILPTTAPGGVGTFKLISLKDNYPSNNNATVRFSVDLATVTNVGGIATGERPSTSPSVAGDIVFYTTTTESAATPCADFSANLYALTFAGTAAYDSYTSNDNKVSNNESPLVRTLAGRATAPFIVDQHLYFGTAGENGMQVEAFGDPADFNNGIGQVGVRILSWREIR